MNVLSPEVPLPDVLHACPLSGDLLPTLASHPYEVCAACRDLAVCSENRVLVFSPGISHADDGSTCLVASDGVNVAGVPCILSEGRVLVVDPEAREEYRAALWEIAAARFSGDSMRSAQATAVLTSLIMGSPAAPLFLVIDVVVEELRNWADEMGKNPACLAEAGFNALYPHLSPPERLVLLGAQQTLFAVDPSGEAGTPHEECSPWPEGILPFSIVEVNMGALATTALTAAAQTEGLETSAPGMRICFAASAVLQNLLRARSQEDPVQLEALLSKRTTQGAIPGSHS